MDEYKTIDIAPEEDALNDFDKTDPIYKAVSMNGDALSASETNRLLREIIENQQKEIKFLKSITTNTSILAGVIVIQIIVTLLIMFR